MGIRNLDPDDDYAYHRTNQSVRPMKDSFVMELEAKARKCLSFHQHPNELLYGVCLTCSGPKYAHTALALKHRKLI